MEMLMKVSFSADTAGLGMFLGWLERELQPLLSALDLPRALLVGEEAAINIVNYAYPDKSGGNYNFTASLWRKKEFLVLILEDEGVPFNPLQNISANPKASLEERVPGGWGRVFLEKFTAYREYEYLDGKNKLRLYFNCAAS